MPGLLSSSKLRLGLALVALTGVGLLLRVPLLANAAFTLSSDEAVAGLIVKHALEGEGFPLFTWGATYFGTLEPLLALPFVWALGFGPLSIKLAAVTGWALLVGTTFLLGARAYGRGAGLLAAALMAGFSPQLVQWSTLAAVGYCLIVAWGGVTLLWLSHTVARPAPWRLFGLGLLLGVGLYLYQLYLVYVAVAAATATLLALRPAQSERRDVPAPASLAARIGMLAGGLTVGWAPKLALYLVPGLGPGLDAGPGGKAPSYLPAGAEQILANLKLLAGECVPALFGVDPAAVPGLRPWVGPVPPAVRALGAVLLATYGVAWLWGALRLRRLWRRAPTGELALALALVVLPPLGAALFLLSREPQDVLANRFLLPWLSSLPVLAAGALLHLWRRQRVAAVLLAGLLAGLPVWQILSWERAKGYLRADGRPAHLREPLHDVLALLEAEGLQGAYGSYWIAYKGTALSHERLPVAPFDDWDRYPPLRRRVAALDRVAYLFRVDYHDMQPAAAAAARRLEERFLNRLASAGRRADVLTVGPFRVYRDPSGRRLLPAGLSARPAALASPRAAIEILAAPTLALPGEALPVRIRLRNDSDAAWSATGDPLSAGSLGVAAAYRWFDRDGRSLVDNPERSLLPGDVVPGAKIEMLVRAPAPAEPGAYELAVTLVQENVAWFDAATGSISLRVPVVVRPAGEPAPEADSGANP